MNLAEAAARAHELAEAGDERGVADLRRHWDDEVEDAVRSPDYRVRALAYRAIGQFRYRQKIELIARGLEDESPACRGSALVSLELLSRDGPGIINQTRRVLHELVNSDPNQAVRRLAIVCLRNGPPARETIVLLSGLAQSEDEERDVRDAAQKVAASLTKKSRTKT